MPDRINYEHISFHTLLCKLQKSRIAVGNCCKRTFVAMNVLVCTITYTYTRLMSDSLVL